MQRLAHLTFRMLPEQQRKRKCEPGRENARPAVARHIARNAECEIGKPEFTRESGGGVSSLALRHEPGELWPRIQRLALEHVDRRERRRDRKRIRRDDW